MEECRKLLVETPLNQLATLQNVVILQDTATVEEALKTLSAHKILSAPVVLGDATDKSLWPAGEGAKDIIGFVDIRDILNSFLSSINVKEVSEMKLLQRMRFLEEQGAAFAQTSLKELQLFGGDGDFLHATQAKVSLCELITYTFLNPQERGFHAGSKLPKVVHRVAIFDNDGRITNIVSQTDIVRFLQRHSDRFPDLAARTIESLGFAGKEVLSTSPLTPAIAALSQMTDLGVSSLAVVDEGGGIIGNFSVSDMRTMTAEQFGALSLPVGEFLAQEHGTDYVGYRHLGTGGGDEEDAADAAVVVTSPAFQFAQDRQARQRPRTAGEEVGQDLVLCSPSATLSEVMQMLVRHRIHRVYVVDPLRRPIGIITCTDILRRLVRVSSNHK